MPAEDIYQSRIMPQAAAPMPLANADTYGAGLADAVGELGNVGLRAEERQRQVLERAKDAGKRLRVDREAADFAHRYALHRTNMDGVIREIRDNPTSPDFAEHVQRVTEADEAAREGLLQGIDAPEVRRQAVQQLDEYGVRLNSTEADYAESQRAAKTVVDYKKTVDIGANRIRQGMDAQHYGEELKAGYAMIDGLAGVTPEVKAKLRLEVEQNYGVAFVNHLNDTNPAAAIALLDAGAFNEILTPEQIDGLRNGAQVEVRRQVAQVAHAATVEKAQLTDATQVAIEKSSQGIDVSADLPELIQRWTAAGDQSKVEQLKGLVRDNAYARVWNDQTPLAREARIRALNGVEAGKRTEDQQAELKWLQEKRGSLDTQFNGDTVGFVMANGQSGEQPPALVEGDPASYAARAQWARTAARTYGRMDLLSHQEREAMAAELGKGDGAYTAVTDQLALFGGAAAKAAARQVAPNDRYLQQLVLLPADYRKLARDGRAALQANPKLVPDENGNDADPDIKAVSTGYERALASLPQEDRNAVKNVARNIAAKFLHDHPGEIDPRLWRQSLSMALGGRGVGAAQRGGLGSWNDMTFLVPDDLSPQQFTDRIFGYIRANPTKGPVNPDGSPANLRNARPVAVGAGVYQFFVGDRPVLARGRDGRIASPWQFTVGGGR